MPVSVFLTRLAPGGLGPESSRESSIPSSQFSPSVTFLPIALHSGESKPKGEAIELDDRPETFVPQKTATEEQK